MLETGEDKRGSEKREERREKRGHCFRVIVSVKGGRVAAFRVSVDCVYGGWLAAHETERTETERDGGLRENLAFIIYTGFVFLFNQSGSLGFRSLEPKSNQNSFNFFNQFFFILG